jgi:hypothetical protein
VTPTVSAPPAAPVQPAQQRWVLAIPMAAALCAALLLAGSPTWRFHVLQFLAALFFGAVLFRSLPRHHDRATVAPTAPPPAQSAGLLLALLAGALAYAPTLSHFFLCDDFEHLNLVRHPFLQSIWPQIAHGQFDGLAFIFYRPIGFASLFLDYRLWHSWTPGYHLTNITLHLLAIAGVFCFCRQLPVGGHVEGCVVGHSERHVPTAAALLFALLPVNVQAVAWIGCRFDLLAAVFAIWALTFAARFRRAARLGDYAIAILLFILAVFSKEGAYLVPLLWLALEWVLPPAPAAGATRASEARLGYILVTVLLIVHRIHTLGGVGGYRLQQDGSPLVQSVDLQSLTGILLRAPAETLFGYNWLQPAAWPVILTIALTAALFLALALGVPSRAGFSASSSTNFGAPSSTNSTPAAARISLFCLFWIFAAAIPAHFYFAIPDPGLFSSRVLYFGAMAVAILIAVLLAQAIANPRLYLAATVAIALLLSAAVQYNLRPWQQAAQQSFRLQSVLQQIEPTPPPHAVFFFPNLPDVLHGVPFFTVGLQSAVQFHYSWRDDIRVRTPKSKVIEATAIPIPWTAQP